MHVLKMVSDTNFQRVDKRKFVSDTIFGHVTIVGLGLIGGSLGLALRRRRLASEVVGLSHRLATLRVAKRRGAIDWGTTDPQAAVAGADLVILATPVDLIVPAARRLARFLPTGAVLTDVGSTKARVVRALDCALPPGLAFVGAHPLAGSEQRGIAAARADLFDGSVCILTPTPRTPRPALAAVARLWRPLAGRVIRMSPEAHDRALAETSHLPHVMAACLALAGARAPLAGAVPSFLAMTRVAKSDPELWDDIFFTNTAPVLAAMDRYAGVWRRLRALLAGKRRAELRRALHLARTRRIALDGR